MAITIRFQGGARAGEVRQFGDEIASITLGRDPDRCQVLFPPEETRVGRQHCELKYALGRYRLGLNRDNPVFLNGQQAIDGEELPAEADLQLGIKGPVLVLTTTLRGDLPPTAGRQQQAGLATRMRWAESKASTGRMVGAAALVLAAVVGVALYVWRLNTEERIGGVEEKVSALRDLSGAEQKAIAQMGRQLGDVDGRVQKLEPQLTAALAKAQESVYLVLGRTDEQSALALGTCWVVDRERGLLATNAHVAEVFRTLPASAKLVAKACAPKTDEFTIDRVEIHPGYNRFDELWITFDPVRRVAHGSSQPIDAGATGCDVALMHVTDASALGPNLPLATPEEIAALAPGEPVGYVGFPMEGIRLGGVNVVSPAPVTHFAYIVAVTDYFGGAGAPLAERLVVQHALPTAGGASGSPLVNRQGHVVAVHSAGNVVGQLDGVRVGSTAMINYAQRSDMVGELLAGNAAKIMADREKGWLASLEKYYKRKPQLAREFQWDDVRDSLARELEAGGEYRVKITPVAGLFDVAMPAAAAPRAGWEMPLELPAGGTYRVAVLGQPNADLEFKLTDAAAGGSAREIRTQAFQGERYVRVATLPATQAVKVQAAVTSPAAGNLVHVAVLRGERERRTPNELMGLLTERWLAGFTAVGGAPPKSRVILEKSLELKDEVQLDGQTVIAHAVDVELPAAGNYLACAATAGEEIGLLAIQEGATELPYPQQGSWVWQMLEPVGPARVRIFLTAAKAGVKCELRVLAKE